VFSSLEDAFTHRLVNAARVKQAPEGKTDIKDWAGSRGCWHMATNAREGGDANLGMAQMSSASTAGSKHRLD